MKGKKDRQNRPVVLMVGRGEPMELALRVALDRRGMQVKSASAGEAVDSAAQVAPDLILLVGDAARGEGEAVLRYLAENPATAVVPVTLLSEEISLEQRMRAFRSGAVAVIPRGASADAMAEKVVRVLDELPQRPGTTAGELGEATLDDLVEWVKKELRTGILTVEPTEGSDEATPMRLVLGAGQPVAEAMEAFVERLRPLIARAEPLRYEFREEAGSRLALLDDLNADEEPDADPSLLSGLRILLMDGDPVRVDTVATALRGRGAVVGVTDASEQGLDRVGGLDPEVVIFDAKAIEGPGFEAVRRMRRDVRMRWSSLLVVRWDELWPDSKAPLPVGTLAGHLAPLIENDRRLTERAGKELRFDTRLELTGPGRLLRALARAGPTLHLLVRAAKATLELDLSEGLVVGAKGTTAGNGERSLEGTAALAGLLALGSGRVHVERRGHPTVMNVMAPVDEALDAAAKEAPPIPISFRPPAAPLKTVPEEGQAAAGTGPGQGTASGGGVKKTLRGTGGPVPPVPSRARASRSREANGSTWEDEDTQPPSDLHMVETARQMAQRSHPPPPKPAAAGGGTRKPRKKTLVGVAPPPPAAPASANAGKGRGRAAAPASSPASGNGASDRPSPSQPLEMAGEHPRAFPDGRETTEEIELADMLEPEGEDPALADTIAPSQGVAPPPPPPPVRASPAPPPPPPPIAAKGMGPPDPATPRPELEATEVLPRSGGGKRQGAGLMWGAAVAALVAAGAMGAIWWGTDKGEATPEPVARGDADAVPGEPEPAPDERAEPGAPPAEEGRGSDEPGVEEDDGTPSSASPDESGEAETPEPAEDTAANSDEGDAEGAPSEEEDDAPVPIDEVANPELESDRLALEAFRLVKSGELDAAEGTVERALALDPENPQAFASMAAYHVARGNTEQALEWARKAVKWRRRRAPYHVILGDALRLDGQDAAARRAYRKALQLDPGNREAREGLR
ncbi:MAG: hypothetical protein ACODAU_09550 [Myxococcota bacterium]